MDLGVFPSSTAPDHWMIRLFPLVALHLPQGPVPDPVRDLPTDAGRRSRTPFLEVCRPFSAPTRGVYFPEAIDQVSPGQKSHPTKYSSLSTARQPTSRCRVKKEETRRSTPARVQHVSLSLSFSDRLPASRLPTSSARSEIRLPEYVPWRESSGVAKLLRWPSPKPWPCCTPKETLGTLAS
jgi:hypothetical protein